MLPNGFWGCRAVTEFGGGAYFSIVLLRNPKWYVDKFSGPVISRLLWCVVRLLIGIFSKRSGRAEDAECSCLDCAAGHCTSEVRGFNIGGLNYHCSYFTD